MILCVLNECRQNKRRKIHNRDYHLYIPSFDGGSDSDVDGATIMRNTGCAYDVVAHINAQCSVLNQQAQKSRDVSRIELARVYRNSGGKIQRSHYSHAFYYHVLAGASHSAVASSRGGKI